MVSSIFSALPADCPDFFNVILLCIVGQLVHVLLSQFWPLFVHFWPLFSHFLGGYFLQFGPSFGRLSAPCHFRYFENCGPILGAKLAQNWSKTGPKCTSGRTLGRPKVRRSNLWSVISGCSKSAFRRIGQLVHFRLGAKVPKLAGRRTLAGRLITVEHANCASSAQRACQLVES